MARLTLAAVLVLVLGYIEARPYYYGYHVPWYPVSPCNPYPQPPCHAYSYPCGAPPPPMPTPCNSQPRHPVQPPPSQQTAEEALLTQDINQHRPVRHGIMNPYIVDQPRPRPRPVRPQWQQPNNYPSYSNPYDPYNNANEYRALKRKPYRRGRFRGGRRMHDEGDYEPMDADEYDEGEDYGDDAGMARDDPMGEDDQEDYENDGDEDEY